ncbi:hypothetical protein QTV49_004567 [Vibrio vulnificus]|nr:hypothetical protein [Vibrio vulnificus]
MMENLTPELTSLKAILDDLETCYSEYRLQSTYALDFLRQQTNKPLSRGETSQLIHEFCEPTGRPPEDELKLLMTICYQFNSIKSNEPLSKIVKFTESVSKTFDLKALNGGKTFSFDHPYPSYLDDII